jgi:metal-responsive CopG/Arc/MetJ family transcriptional regulator
MSHKLLEEEKKVIVTITIDRDILNKIDSMKDNDRGRSNAINNLLHKAIMDNSESKGILDHLSSSEKEELNEAAKRMRKDIIFTSARAMSIGLVTILETKPPLE